jgi:UTP:GlnB (protein PII) uridylyltransferase
VTDASKIAAIEKVLEAGAAAHEAPPPHPPPPPAPPQQPRRVGAPPPHPQPPPQPPQVETHTVFEVAGRARVGTLARISSLLLRNGVCVESAAVWTHHGSAAYVMGVADLAGRPVADGLKLSALAASLLALVDGGDGRGHVRTETARAAAAAACLSASSRTHAQ